MPNPIIDLQSVNKIYTDGVQTQVLFDINLSIQPGTFNAIIGQSGSGKSTLLNLIGTLDKASSGKLTVMGQETTKMKENALAKLRNDTIGFVFQFHYLLPEFTAFENVLMPALIHGKSTQAARDRANELLDLVGLSSVKNKLSTKLSGGQQQRTAIARALMNKPTLILADEPTGNLDSVTTKQIYELFRKINQEIKTTFVVITHDERIAQQADRIITIADGRIANDSLKS
jgi:lipoprotein-releasing system ATP-binding protein